MNNVTSYTIDDIINGNIQDFQELDKSKPILVEHDGIQSPVFHTYVVTQEMVNNGDAKEESLGCLVFDLDV